jgi:Asp-tRNA(Asn)/Glu-tRNA(Gln) amidotransferase A subunit family amidase
LPVGIQVVAPAHRDVELMAAARLLLERLGRAAGVAAQRKTA